MAETTETTLAVTTPDRIETERNLPVPIERVWAALTDPAELCRWFGETAEVDLSPGGAMYLGFGADGDAHCVVETVEPPSRFAFRWEAEGSAALDLPVTPMTLVEFFLDPIPGGTRLRLVESGFAALPESIRRSAHEGNIGGWQHELDELVAMVSSDDDARDPSS
ncbi:MAG: SRPBCC domain-containing protein [Thermomicrobiales bacterium]